MAQDDTIQNIIERIESARDRFQNAADDHGVVEANQALVDLRSLRSSALPAAHEIEEYFNQRASIHATKTKGSRVPDDDSIDDSSDDS
jgi:hypothetical protein